MIDRLDRARDIATELAGRARSLERQARAAERAAEVEAEVAAAAAALRGAIAAHAHADLARADAHRRQSLAARDQAVTERGRTQEVLETQEADRLRLVSNSMALSERAASLREAVERCEARSEVIRERLVSVVDRLAQRAQERRQAETDLIALDAQAEVAARGLREVAETLNEDEHALRVAEEFAHETARALEAALASAAERAERKARFEREAGEVRLRLETAQATHERMVARDAELSALADGRFELARAERRVEIASQRRARQSARVGELQDIERTCQASVDGASARLRLAASEADRFAGTRAPDPDTATVAGGLTAMPGMERALAAALGALADAPIAGDLAGATSLVEAGASTVVTSAASVRDPGVKGAKPLRTAIASIDDASRPYLEQLLRDGWLIERLADVPREATGVWVTPEGVAFWPESGVVSSTQSEWARRALHARALADADSARAIVLASGVELEAARAELRRAEARGLAFETPMMRVNPRAPSAAIATETPSTNC